MPVLANPKHERFAQELAKGASQVEAYRLAGYKPAEGHAARLAGNGKVRARVAELLERAAVRAEITVATLTNRLVSIADKAEEIDGPAALAVARAALMDAAKLNGLVKHQHELAGRNGAPIEFRNLSDEEIEARIAALTGGAIAPGVTAH